MRRAGIFIGFCMAASSLFSQGISDSVFVLREVEVQARQLFRKEEAGLIRTIMDTVLLEDKAAFSLSELLSQNSTVFIKSNGRGAMSSASFRGTAASHTKVSWNGISVNSPMLGMVDFSLIPVYLLDGVELLHGAASLAEQGGGIGGLIQIENRPDWENGLRARFIQGIGSYRTFDEFIQVEGGNRVFQSRTRVYHNKSRNDYTFINRGIGDIDPETGSIVNPLDTNSNAAYRNYGLLQEFHYRPGEGHILSLMYWGQAADRAIPWPTSYEGPDNANLNSQEHVDHKLVARWKYYSTLGNFLLRSGYAGKEMDYRQLRRVPGLGLDPDIVSLSSTHSLLNTLGWNREMAHGLSGEARVELNHHRVDTRDTVSGLGYEEYRGEVSLFGALRKSFRERLNLNLMLRQGWVDGKRIPFIPFLGADFRILEGHELIARASVARNYHLPTLNDLYWQPNGNPDLLPEEGYSLDGGLDYQDLILGQVLQTSLTLYHSRILNWIMWIPSSRLNLEPMNIREVRATGMELALGLKGGRGEFRYRVSGNYAWTRSLNLGDPLVWGDESYGKQLVYIPEHSGNAFVNLGYKRFHVSYQYNAYGERYTTSSNALNRRDWLYPYFMNDLGLGAGFRAGRADLSLGLEIRNLFNERYHSVLYRPMPGRNYLLVLKAQI